MGRSHAGQSEVVKGSFVGEGDNADLVGPRGNAWKTESTYTTHHIHIQYGSVPILIIDLYPL